MNFDWRKYQEERIQMQLILNEKRKPVTEKKDVPATETLQV
jgi:hypothetical protein